jgi:hypothetical protein
MRVCAECGKEKDITEFHKDKKWYRGVCKACRCAMARLNHYHATHTALLACEKCYFLEVCRSRIEDMFWWPYCMRKD